MQKTHLRVRIRLFDVAISQIRKFVAEKSDHVWSADRPTQQAGHMLGHISIISRDTSL